MGTEITSAGAEHATAAGNGFPAGVVGSLIYALARVLLDVIAIRRRERAELEAEVLVPRRKVQVLRAPDQRVRWTPLLDRLFD